MVYSQGAYPFDTPHNGNTLKWWIWLEKHPQANVLTVSNIFLIYQIWVLWKIYLFLQMLAIKIYSIVVNSMANEQIGSKFTWFNSALWGNQNVETLKNMIQVGQYYGTHMVYFFLSKHNLNLTQRSWNRKRAKNQNQFESLQLGNLGLKTWPVP